MRIVAIGGGHGLSATVAAARLLDAHVTAVVSMADDGGSSGRLRSEFEVLPPGDLRMALLALADPAHERLARLLRHRFDGDGDLGGHSVGNLALTALWQQGLSVVESLRELGALLGVTGAVLPVATVPHTLVADVTQADGTVEHVVGQARIASSTGSITRLCTVPEQVPACAEAVAAIGSADVVVLGPGSWFTSVLAPLCVDTVADAITAADAAVVLVTNLQSAAGEAPGFTVQDYLDSLYHAHPRLRVDAVIAPSGSMPLSSPVLRIDYHGGADRHVHVPAELARCLRQAANSLAEGQRERL